MVSQRRRASFDRAGMRWVRRSGESFGPLLRPRRVPPLGVLLGLLLAALLPLLPGPIASAEERRLLLATTTSVQESGLLDALLPEFARDEGYAVRVIAVGSGAAIAMARKGDVDVVLAHSPEDEEALVRDGFVARRTPLMENFFVLAGPPEDPAEAAGVDSPEAALARIFARKAPFVSRADRSGTHMKERSLVEAAGLDPETRWPGYTVTGIGMGPSLLVAGERRAYILSDLGTFLAFRDRIGLVVLSKPAPALRNVYSILRLDPRRFERPLESKGAAALERHLLSPDVQRRIRDFGRDRFGESLFSPLRLPSDGEP